MQRNSIIQLAGKRLNVYTELGLMRKSLGNGRIGKLVPNDVKESMLSLVGHSKTENNFANTRWRKTEKADITYTSLRKYGIRVLRQGEQPHFLFVFPVGTLSIKHSYE